jgi:hypothetical protein
MKIAIRDVTTEFGNMPKNIATSGLRRGKLAVMRIGGQFPSRVPAAGVIPDAARGSTCPAMVQPVARHVRGNKASIESAATQDDSGLA